MNISKLEKNLDSAIDKYIKETEIRYKRESIDPVTHNDIYEANMQTAYLLNDFKKSIVDFLK